MTINTPFPPHPPSFTPWERPSRGTRKSPDILGSRDEPIDYCDHCGAILLRFKGGDHATKIIQRLLKKLVRLLDRAVADGELRG